jgi:N-acetylmuramic acid 6-phosphate (MurNAc-6-P) etherase
MDHMNITHMEIEEKRMIVHGHTFKKCLQNLKERNKKIHKASQNMVSVFSNMNKTMCHAFIFDEKNMPPLVNLDSISSNEK